MPDHTQNPMIIQGDRSVLLAVDNDLYQEARDVLASLATLGEGERAALNRRLLRGGTAPTRSLRRELIGARLAADADTSGDQAKPSWRYRFSSVPYARGYAGHPQRTDWEIFEDVIARLTPAGRAILDDGAAALQGLALSEGEGTGPVIIQPNFQLMAPGPVRLDWLARLDLFAERERADRGAFEYRLSQGSVYRAQRLGMAATEVLRFLQEVVSVELPQNVRRSLEEWTAHYEWITFRTGVSLLQAADAELLDQLLDQPQIGEHLARPIADDVALLKKLQRG